MIGRRVFVLGTMGALGGCASAARTFSSAPYLAVRTQSMDDLETLPPPEHKLYTAVFAFLDETGQHKPNQNFAEYSFAVTQGGTSILINALHEAGNGKWFEVLERARLTDLLQERQIIRANRLEFPGPDGKPLPPVGPLLNAGSLFEGGIIGYDSDLITGGAGASYLGIGGDVKYRKDNVQVYMRTVSVINGEILTSVVANKTIYSVALQGSIFRFVGFNKLLQAEAGLTTNEPVELAVKQAIELGVYATIMEGCLAHIWSFADPAKQAALLKAYMKTRGGMVDPALLKKIPPPAKVTS